MQGFKDQNSHLQMAIPQKLCMPDPKLVKPKLSTSIYDLVTFIFIVIVIVISHFLKFVRYRDTRAYILDPCIQEFSLNILHDFLENMKIVGNTGTNALKT